MIIYIKLRKNIFSQILIFNKKQKDTQKSKKIKT